MSEDKRVSRAEQARAVADAVLAHPDRHQLDALVGLARDRLGTAGAGLAMLHSRQVMLSLAGIAGDMASPGDEFPFEDTICSLIAQTEVPAVISDTRSDPRISSTPPVARGGVGAYLGVPVMYEERIVGVLCVIERAQRTWRQEDIETLEQLAPKMVDEVLRLVDLDATITP